MVAWQQISSHSIVSHVVLTGGLHFLRWDRRCVSAA
jgi:hypothetical protein